MNTQSVLRPLTAPRCLLIVVFAVGCMSLLAKNERVYGSRDGDVTPPSPIKIVRPEVRPGDLVGRVEKLVVLSAVIEKHGWPRHCKVKKSDDNLLDERAIATAGKWRFAPSQLAGKSVRYLVTLEVRFRAR